MRIMMNKVVDFFTGKSCTVSGDRWQGWESKVPSLHVLF